MGQQPVGVGHWIQEVAMTTKAYRLLAEAMRLTALYHIEQARLHRQGDRRSLAHYAVMARTYFQRARCYRATANAKETR